MAMMRKPFFSNCSIMSPMAFLATASGLTIVKVRCRVFMISLFVLGRCLTTENIKSGVLRLGCRTHRRHYGLPNVRRRLGDANSGRFHGLNLLRRRALAPGNDGASMAHSASRRRGLTGDESHHRLLHSSLYVFGSSFFGVSADFPDHHHHFGLRVLVEQLERIQKICPDNRIAAYADCCGLTDVARRELID